MLYITKILLEVVNGVNLYNSRGNFYYSILGIVLSLLDKKKSVKDKILKISYRVQSSDILEVSLSFFWDKAFKNFVEEVLSSIGGNYKLKGLPFKLKSLSFEFFHLTKEKIRMSLKDDKYYNQIKLSFFSPTVVRRGRKEILLPISDVYLSNILDKIQTNQYLSEWVKEELPNIDKNDFKKWLANYVLPQKFRIKTTIFELKNGKMVGVLGNIDYWIWNQDWAKFMTYLKLLKLQSLFAPYVGLGSFTRLGLGNVWFKILKTK